MGKPKAKVRRTIRPLRFILEKTVARKAAKEKQAVKQMGSNPEKMLKSAIAEMDKKIAKTSAEAYKGHEIDIKQQERRRTQLQELKQKAEQGTITEKELKFAKFYSEMMAGGRSRAEAAKRAGITEEEAKRMMYTIPTPSEIAREQAAPKVNVPAKESITLVKVREMKGIKLKPGQYILTPEMQKKIDAANRKISLTTKKQVAEELIFDYGYSPEAVVQAFGKTIDRKQLEEWGYAKRGRLRVIKKPAEEPRAQARVPERTAREQVESLPRPEEQLEDPYKSMGDLTKIPLYRKLRVMKKPAEEVPAQRRREVTRPLPKAEQKKPVKKIRIVEEEKPKKKLTIDFIREEPKKPLPEQKPIEEDMADLEAYLRKIEEGPKKKKKKKITKEDIEKLKKELDI
ncbi:MAG: hypothetical protein JXA43_00325 [Candidatus Diapherotrites archaeon]|nr:hypothetical protein [Candidatus Diapherotrites archaeon]